MYKTGQQASLERWSKTIPKAKYRLNLNEMPVNLPLDLRRRITKVAEHLNFNLYPPYPLNESLLAEIANWYRVDASKMLVANGSSELCRTLLTYYGINNPDSIVIARPSFTYYERYCKFYNIPYKTWDLDENYEYDPQALDKLRDKSVVFLASPNNPTGGVITKEKLVGLLTKHKTSLFVVDEAYAEFAGESKLPLIDKFDNLIILRTFSKAFCAAGIRFGCLFAQRSLIKKLEPLQSPREITEFTLGTVKEILAYEKENSWFDQQIKMGIKERERLYQKCVSLKSKTYKVYPSKGNFLFIKSKGSQSLQILLSKCEQNGIAIKGLGDLPKLSGCARVTIGKPKENDLFFKILVEAIGIRDHK
jgi:histidinol-phosphate aminotransferase